LSFYGNYVRRIDRAGRQEIYAQEGLSGPVGLAFDSEGDLYANNCRGNSISRISQDRDVEVFAESPLFKCPNGITTDRLGSLCVVNFSDEKVLRILASGEVTELAVLPGGGNGHVTWARGKLYATSFRGHRIYSISTSGDVELVAGTGGIGESDGPGSVASFSWPNGIASGPNGDRLYVNDFIDRFPPTTARPPVPLSSVRMIKLASITSTMAAALQSGGILAMIDEYRRFKPDPSTASLYTELEVNGFGYRSLASEQLDAAVAAFKLNAESYPASFNVYDSLAEAYLRQGDRDQATDKSRKSVELNGANPNTVEKLRELGAE
jgi:DNA-binding beta-propeller fold protein YncE